MQPPPSMDVDSDDEEEEGDLPEYPNLSGIDSGSLANAAEGSSAYGTPHRPATSQNFPAEKSLKLQAKAISNELEQYPTTSDSYADDLFKNVVKDKKQVLKFVATSKLYKDGQWVLKVPSDPSKLKEDKLGAPFKAILSAIIARFIGASRMVHDTHNVRLQHKEGHYSSPDFTISATGLSFETPAKGPVGFCNAATVIDLKRDCEMKKSVNIEQLGIYVRYVVYFLVTGYNI